METKGLKKTLTRDILVTLDLDGMIQDLKYLYLKIIRLALHRHKMI